MTERVIARIVSELKECSFVKGIVLGGSRATGMADAESDIDIGIYYERGRMDDERINLAAQRLDDAQRENLICPEGGWGRWVNCGGWLMVEGRQVDLIFRDMERVRECIDQTEQGDISIHYQTGHPHAYLNVMYRGEMAASKVLYSGDDDFAALKRRAEIYPDSLKTALISFFLFEAGFSCEIARKAARNKDVYYIAGHLFRAISGLNQVLFAVHGVYCLNEKKATKRAEMLERCPHAYAARAEQILSFTSESCMHSILELEQLYHEVAALAEEEKALERG